MGTRLSRVRAVASAVRALTVEERRFAFAAWLLAAPVELSLHAFGLRATLGWIDDAPSLWRDSTIDAERGERLVAGAFALHPSRGTCLPRSLVQLLAHRLTGGAPTFRVGVRRTSERLDAHAWVETSGARSVEFEPILSDVAS